jgi:hypothetical protein
VLAVGSRERVEPLDVVVGRVQRGHDLLGVLQATGLQDELDTGLADAEHDRVAHVLDRHDVAAGVGDAREQRELSIGVWRARSAMAARAAWGAREARRAATASGGRIGIGFGRHEIHCPTVCRCPMARC